MGDLPAATLEALLRRAEEFRLLRNLRQPHATRPGTVLGMVFEKASTRTRASFEVAMFDLGGHALALDNKSSQIGRGEPIADPARCCPAGYQPDAGIGTQARATGRGKVTFTTRPIEATAGRHVLSTDVFTSMGQEAETQERLKAFAGYCLDGRLLGAADPGAIVLHCLPAHRGEEITADVIDGPNSVVWQQAENRLHAQKALLELLLT